MKKLNTLLATLLALASCSEDTTLLRPESSISAAGMPVPVEITIDVTTSCVGATGTTPRADFDVAWNRKPGGSKFLVVTGSFGPSATPQLFFTIEPRQTSAQEFITTSPIVIDDAGFAKKNGNTTMYQTTVTGAYVQANVFTHPGCPLPIS